MALSLATTGAWAAGQDSIRVTVTIANQGAIAVGKNDTLMAQVPVTVTDRNGDGKFTYDEAMAAELGRSISAFLRTQSEEVRSMFILRYFYCEPVEALAARFHCGESRIKTALLRTRRKLKEHLIKEGYCEA